MIDYLPPQSLILTFADGHIRNYDFLPVLKAKKTPVTLFLCAGLIDTKRHFWFKHKIPTHRSSELRKMPSTERFLRHVVWNQQRPCHLSVGLGPGPAGHEAGATE